MSTEDTAVDETENFVVTSSDTPVIETTDGDAEAKADDKPTDEPKPEVDDTKAEGDEKKPESDDDGKQEQDKKQDPGKDTAAEQEDATPKKGKNRVQKRIDEVVRERENEKRDHEKTKRELAELKSKGNKDQENQQVKEPAEDDFDTYDEYLTALDKHSKGLDAETKKPEKAPARKPEDSHDKDQNDDLTDSQKTAMAVIRDKVDEGAKNYTDFEEVALSKEVPIDGTMLEALAECDDPAKVMYHLGKNLELASDIAGLSPAQQMREITKLDLSVTVKPDKPKKTTNASDPITPVAGSDSQEKPIGELSFSDYEKKMNKQERERGAQQW